jgi:hypothetical protein
MSDVQESEVKRLLPLADEQVTLALRMRNEARFFAKKKKKAANFWLGISVVGSPTRTDLP